MLKKVFVTIALVLAATVGAASAAERSPATLYKNPQCSCCEQYAKYLRRNGFEVKIVPTHDLSGIKRQAGGVPEKLEGCHTMFVGKYIVEGHVPIKTLDRLLTERPNIRGISLPGMPQGSPGMTGEKSEPFTIYEIGNESEYRVYTKE